MDDLQRRLEADNSDVGRLLKALFLPKLYANNLRFASEGAGVSSATGNLSQIFDVSEDWAAATTSQQIGASDMMCFQFANPLRAFVYFIHNAAGLPYIYDATSLYGPTNLTWPCQIGMVSQSIFTGAVANAVPVFQPHGTYLAPGHDDAGNTYLWVDGSPAAGATNNMQVTFTVAPATTGGVIVWYVWNGKNATLYDWTQFVIATGTYVCPTAPPNGGAYMFVRVYNLVDNAVTTYSVQVIGNRGCWAHRPIPFVLEYTTTTAGEPFRVSGIRVNAAAFKAQNNSQEIEKNGNEISVTVASEIPWSKIAAGTAYLSQLQNYRERSNAKGYYGVLLPDSDDDISDFFDDIMPQATSPVGTATGSCTSYPLNERRPYKALGITSPSAAGRYFLFDVTHAIEYLTNWQIQSLDNPRTSEESLLAAIVIASTMETDYENPSHWETIVNTIGKFGNRAVALQTSGPGSDILDAISKFHPAMGLARQIGKNLVLPGQRQLFNAMQDYGNSKRARKQTGRWVPAGGGQLTYLDM
jgi:hypothetical protein